MHMYVLIYKENLLIGSVNYALPGPFNVKQDLYRMDIVMHSHVCFVSYPKCYTKHTYAYMYMLHIYCL